MTFTPATGRPWRDAWPAVAQTDDANRWLTGACWLYCRRDGVRVLWVGSVNAPGATGDVFACGPCLAELDHMVRVQSYGRDAPADRAAQAATLTVPAHASPPRSLPADAFRPSPTAPWPAEWSPRTPTTAREDPMRTTAKPCEHRQTERRDGKTYCRDCKRQLYL